MRWLISTILPASDSLPFSSASRSPTTTSSPRSAPLVPTLMPRPRIRSSRPRSPSTRRLSLPRTQWGTITFSRRALLRPSLAMVSTAQSMVSSSALEPLSRCPKRSATKASRSHARVLPSAWPVMRWAASCIQVGSVAALPGSSSRSL